VAAFLGRNSAPAPMSPEAAARVMRAETNEVDDTVRETRMPEESAATAPDGSNRPNKWFLLAVDSMRQ
jgi:hypothetical protein